MDETTKILIGTISGFIVAFFAEPVKQYFLTRAKVSHLRTALYSEIYNNYNILAGFLKIYGRVDVKKAAAVFRGTIKHSIRTECYKYYISSQSDLFYQLSEASQLNIIYTSLFSLIDPELYPTVHDFRFALDSFPRMVERSFAENKLFVNIMKKTIGKESMDQIFENYKLFQNPLGK